MKTHDIETLEYLRDSVTENIEELESLFTEEHRDTLKRLGMRFTGTTSAHDIAHFVVELLYRDGGIDDESSAFNYLAGRLIVLDDTHAYITSLIDSW